MIIPCHDHPELIGLAALLFAAAVTYLVRSAGRKKGWFAPLRRDRWHQGKVTLHGGVGIFFGFVGAYLLARPAWVQGDALLVLAAGGMFFLGFVDDLVTLRPVHKLVGQIFAAAALTAFGLRLHWTGLGVVDVGLTLLWLVGLANAVNLLDNIDGLAGGTAFIAAAVEAYLFWSSGQTGQACMAASLAGAAGGFLLFNIHPASIFMGDGGSLFLGFMLGGLVLLDHPSGSVSQVGQVAAPLLVLSLPILDTTLVTLSRLLAGRPLSQGGRDHTSHRLVALGLSETRAVAVLWGLAALAGGLAILVRSMPWAAAATLVGLFLLAAVFLALFVGRVPVYDRDGGTEGKGRTDDGDTDGRAESKATPVSPAGSDRPATSSVRAGVASALRALVAAGRRARVFEVLNDLVCILAALFGAFLLRWGGEYVEPHYHLLIKALPGLVVIQLGSLVLVGLYRSMWRYTTVGDLVRIAMAAALGVLASVAFLVAVFRFQGYSRAMFLLDALLLSALLALSRLSFRLLDTWLESARQARGPKALIYGAGAGGRLCLAEMRANPDWDFRVIGFIDDDPTLKGRSIQGVRVLGGLDDVPALAQSHDVAVLVVAIRNLSEEAAGRLDRLCADLDLDCRRLSVELVEMEGGSSARAE